MEPTTVNAVAYTWKNEDGTFFVKIYDSASGIFGSATHKNRETAMTLAKVYFEEQCKNIISVIDCDMVVDTKIESKK